MLCPAHSYLGTNLLPGKDVQLCLCSATAGKSVSQEIHYMLIDPGSGTHVASLLPSQGQLDSPCTSLPGINSRQFLKSCLPGAEDKFLLTFNLRISSLNLADNLLISRLLESALSAASVSPSSYKCTWVAWVLFLALAFHPSSSKESVIAITSFIRSLCR